MSDGEGKLTELMAMGPGSLVSLVGAGGKTTTMYALCREARDAGLTSISTTTTAIQPPTASQSRAMVVRDESADLLESVRDTLSLYGHLTVVGSRLRAGKLGGVSEKDVTALRALADVVVVESDGARHHAIKAPAEHEPVVHPDSTHFLSVAGLHALGRVLSEASHRPEIAARLAGLAAEDLVTTEALARLLTSKDGGLKGCPPGARSWAVLTHLTPDNQPEAVRIAERLQRAGVYTGVVALSRTSATRLA